MRNFFIIILTVLIVISCGRTGQFQEVSAELAAEWEATTDLMISLAEKTAEEQARIAALKTGKQPKSVSIGRFRENYLARADQLKSKFTGYQSALDRLSEEVQNYIHFWEGKKQLIQELEQGLAAGKLPADAPNQIAELMKLTVEGKEKVNAWETEISQITGQCESINNQFLALTASE